MVFLDKHSGCWCFLNVVRSILDNFIHNWIHTKCFVWNTWQKNLLLASVTGNSTQSSAWPLDFLKGIGYHHQRTVCGSSSPIDWTSGELCAWPQNYCWFLLILIHLLDMTVLSIYIHYKTTALAFVLPASIQPICSSLVVCFWVHLAFRPMTSAFLGVMAIDLPVG